LAGRYIVTMRAELLSEELGKFTKLRGNEGMGMKMYQ